jgi:hypothetical protein
VSDSLVIVCRVVLVDAEGDDGVGGREVRSSDGLSAKRTRDDQGEQRTINLIRVTLNRRRCLISILLISNVLEEARQKKMR